MAVYTHITEDELESFLSLYDLGTLKTFEGIEKGVSNTNYHVFTDRGRYILTIFEEHRTKREHLPYLFAYAGHLASKGVPCPQVFLDKKGEAIGTIQGKPAALVSYLLGQDIQRGYTMEEHCREMGAFLAKMHTAVDDFPLHRDIDWSLGVFREKAEYARDKLDGNRPDLVKLLFDELDFLDKNYPSDDLPQGAVHLDLFPDNIFFNNNGRIMAMIDMYFACTEAFAYDLAITVNAWCFDQNGAYQPKRFKELMAAYEKIRPLQDIERNNFQLILRAATMRFLVSRMEELLDFKPDHNKMMPHDPQEYINRLKFHQDRDIINE